MDFRVSPNEELIAIAIEIDKLIIIDSNGKIIKNYEKEELILDEVDKMKSFNLLTWSDDSTHLWSCLYDNAVRTSVLDVQSENWRVNSYSFSEFPIGVNMGDDFDLNPNNGLIVFSNIPVILDTDTRKEFEESKQEVTLYVYDLKNKELQTIDTSVAKKFNPKWISNDTIEYDHPINNERVQYRIGN